MRNLSITSWSWWTTKKYFTRFRSK